MPKQTRVQTWVRHRPRCNNPGNGVCACTAGCPDFAIVDKGDSAGAGGGWTPRA